MSIDFKRISDAAIKNAVTLLSAWLPNGKLNGKEYTVGSLNGEAGRSLSINIETGVWRDFAADIGGGDLIDLYAKIHRLDMAKSASCVSAAVGLGDIPVKSTSQYNIVPDGSMPDWESAKYGNPSGKWTYRSMSGEIIGYIARYDHQGEKIYWPYLWNGEKFAKKIWPAPRPLYGLELLALYPDHHVLIVEGEKAADAARIIVHGQKYIVLSWSGGVSSIAKSDWSVLEGRSVLLWPDADKHEKDGKILPVHEQPGTVAMAKLVDILSPYCPTIKVINVGDVQKDGWDAADALEEGWTWSTFYDWATQDGRTKEVKRVTPKQSEEDVASVDLSVNYAGRPHSNTANVVRCLDQHPSLAGKIWYDEFRQTIYTTWRGEKRAWNDALDIELLCHIQEDFGMPKIAKSHIQDAVQLVAQKNKKNSLLEYLGQLHWDGQDRLSSLFPVGFGTEDTEYYRRIGECWMISLAARAYEPGCQVDTMPIIEGNQGTRKSSMLRALGGEFFTECHEPITSKDFYLVFSGYWIVELSELSSLSRAGAERVKGIISNRIDRYRAPYARVVENHPRGCVFVGSVNRDDWNSDPTGARRFWPVLSGVLDEQWIVKNRDQILAQAVHAYKSGADWWKIPTQQADEMRAERYSVHPFAEVISQYLQGNKFIQFTTEDILISALEMPPAQMKREHRITVNEIMRNLGWINIPKSVDGVKKRLWIWPA